jgi:hypothetical protein
MKIIALYLFMTCTLIACSQDRGPGYSFGLFRNTPVWNLAKAAEKEDESQMESILKDKGIDINLRDSTYGSTLLQLCIGNDKLISTRVLLEHGAHVNILDSEKRSAIHEATSFIKTKKYTYKILELLLKYGSNPNDLLIKKKNGDTIYTYVPLMGAIEDLNCAKLLIEHGANPYYRDGEDYMVWKMLFVLDAKFEDNIYVAKYMIIDKKLKIPNPIFYTIPDHKPVSALDLLNEFKVTGDPQKEKIKNEIMNYLHQIDFPKNGIYEKD